MGHGGPSMLELGGLFQMCPGRSLAVRTGGSGKMGPGMAHWGSLRMGLGGSPVTGPGKSPRMGPGDHLGWDLGEHLRWDLGGGPHRVTDEESLRLDHGGSPGVEPGG